MLLMFCFQSVLKLLVKCYNQSAPALFRGGGHAVICFKQKANDGVDGGVILMHSCDKHNSQD